MKEPKLNRKLVLEERNMVLDGAGGLTGGWIARGLLWADVSARTGRESVAAGIEQATVSTRIIVRGAPEGAASRPRPDQRFREGDRLFDIKAVTEIDQSGKYLLCYTVEGEAG